MLSRAWTVQHHFSENCAAGSKIEAGQCDFDLMMEARKAANRSMRNRKRSRRDIELINDNDDAIARLIADMRAAAREDREGEFASIQCPPARLALQADFPLQVLLSAVGDSAWSIFISDAWVVGSL